MPESGTPAAEQPKPAVHDLAQALEKAKAFAVLRYVLPDSLDAPVERFLKFPPKDEANGAQSDNWAAVEKAALEWTYILRSRQRWLSSTRAADDHIQRATETLQSFGLSHTDLQ